MANIYQREMFTESAMGNVKDALSQVGSIGSQVKQQGQEEKQQADVLLNQARKRYSQQLNNLSTVEFDNVLANYGSDPVKAQEEMNKIRDNIANEIEDTEVKSDYLAEYDIKSRSYMNKINSNYVKKVKAETLDMNTQSFANNLEDMTMAYENNMAGSSSLEDEIVWGELEARQEVLIDSKYADGSDVYSPFEKQKMRKQMTDMRKDISKNYINQLDDLDKLNAVSKLTRDEYTLGNGKNLKEMLSPKDYLQVKGWARSIMSKYEGFGSNMDEREKIQKSALQQANYENIDNALDSMGIDKKNIMKSVADFDETKISQLYNLRYDAVSKYQNGNLDTKDYQELMKTITPAMYASIERSRKRRGTWFTSYSNNFEAGQDAIDNALKQSNVYRNPTVITGMYSRLYDELVTKGIGIDSKDKVEASQKIAGQLVKEFMQANGKFDEKKMESAYAEYTNQYGLIASNEKAKKKNANVKYQVFKKDGKYFKQQEDGTFIQVEQPKQE